MKMIQEIVLLRRRPGMDRDEFRRYWRENHAPLAAKFPGLRKYVQAHVIPDPSQEGPSYDGVAELWFDSVEALQAAIESPEGQAARADFPNFLDVDKTQIMIAEDVTIV
jgi:uncharacterized protein (TIGR02118 family)